MDEIIRWLLKGDVAIRYLTHRDLLDSDEEILNSLHIRIETEGYGARYLSFRNENGHWGKWFLHPGWTATHHTLAELKNIGMPAGCTACRRMVSQAMKECMLKNGAISFSKIRNLIDISINGTFLNYASYFCPDDHRLPILADYLLSEMKSSGGYGRDPHADVSDPNTTIAVLEGFHSFQKAGFKYRLGEIHRAEERAREYLLSNQLFILEGRHYLRLSYPYRNHYDLLRALNYLADAKIPTDERMEPAFRWLVGKRGPDGRWQLENIYRGKVHFNPEEIRRPSRFVTLKALYIIRIFEKELLHKEEAVPKEENAVKVPGE